MGTYNDFLRQHSGTKARVRRLYWVYGEEDMLRLLTVEQVKQMSGATAFNTTRLSALDTPETEIWAHLNQHPLDSDQQRLLIVRDAQELQHEDRLESWIKDNQITRGRNATAVFVSTDPEWEHPVREVVSKSSSAALVKCTLPKNVEDRFKRSQEIVNAWGGDMIDLYLSGLLVKRVNYDMAAALSVIRKAALFPEYRLTPKAIEELVERRVESDIVWSLLALNKQAASEALEEADSEISGNVIGTLATHVEMLGRINAVLGSTDNPREAAGKIRVREQYVRQLFPYARLYPKREVVRRTLLLTRIDAAWQSGAREGVLQSLVALW